MGHFDLPWSEALPPHAPLTRTKMGKINHFWPFIFLPPHPHPTTPTPTTPTPTKIIWCSHWKKDYVHLKILVT